MPVTLTCETTKVVEVLPDIPEPAIVNQELKDFGQILELSENPENAPWVYIAELHRLIVETQVWYDQFLALD